MIDSIRHGSRLTNYAGILTQGLRIAPPEAPVVSTIGVEHSMYGAYRTL